MVFRDISVFDRGDSIPSPLQIKRPSTEKFVIIGFQTCEFRYNRILNICFTIMTLKTLTLCYYNIMALK